MEPEINPALSMFLSALVVRAGGNVSVSYDGIEELIENKNVEIGIMIDKEKKVFVLRVQERKLLPLDAAQKEAAKADGAQCGSI